MGRSGTQGTQLLPCTKSMGDSAGKARSSRRTAPTAWAFLLHTVCQTELGWGSEPSSLPRRALDCQESRMGKPDSHPMGASATPSKESNQKEVFQ